MLFYHDIAVLHSNALQRYDFFLEYASILQIFCTNSEKYLLLSKKFTNFAVEIIKFIEK